MLNPMGLSNIADMCCRKLICCWYNKHTEQKPLHTWSQLQIALPSNDLLVLRVVEMTVDDLSYRSEAHYCSSAAASSVLTFTTCDSHAVELVQLLSPSLQS